MRDLIAGGVVGIDALGARDHLAKTLELERAAHILTSV
jgi:hypothetical protein